MVQKVLTLSAGGALTEIVDAKQDTLSGTGFVKSTAGTISYDTSTYLTTTGTAADSSKLGGQLPAYYQTALGYTPINKAGDVMSGTLRLGSSYPGTLSLDIGADPMVGSGFYYNGSVYKHSIGSNATSINFKDGIFVFSMAGWGAQDTDITWIPQITVGYLSATFHGNVGFNGTAAIAKPTITGSRGGNAALASLLTALVNYGLITDSTTA